VVREYVRDGEMADLLAAADVVVGHDVRAVEVVEPARCRRPLVNRLIR
jgi:hypothetical protein